MKIPFQKYRRKFPQPFSSDNENQRNKAQPHLHSGVCFHFSEYPSTFSTQTHKILSQRVNAFFIFWLLSFFSHIAVLLFRLYLMWPQKSRTESSFLMGNLTAAHSLPVSAFCCRTKMAEIQQGTRWKYTPCESEKAFICRR